MDREIKYRFWNTDHIEQPWMEVGDTADIKFVERSIGKHKMLFTGLQDKNGKEIYEGDFFHMGDKKLLHIVVWHDTGFMGKQNGAYGSYVGLLHWRDRIEVIGNIYETPELLNKRTKDERNVANEVAQLNKKLTK